jgi:hypothetical protein
MRKVAATISAASDDTVTSLDSLSLGSLSLGSSSGRT